MKRFTEAEVCRLTGLPLLHHLPREIRGEKLTIINTKISIGILRRICDFASPGCDRYAWWNSGEQLRSLLVVDLFRVISRLSLSLSLFFSLQFLLAVGGSEG